MLCNVLHSTHTTANCSLPAGQVHRRSFSLCTNPLQGANLPLRLTVAGQQSGSVSFSYNPPHISSVSPVLLPTAGTPHAFHHAIGSHSACRRHTADSGRFKLRSHRHSTSRFKGLRQQRTRGRIVLAHAGCVSARGRPRSEQAGAHHGPVAIQQPCID